MVSILTGKRPETTAMKLHEHEINRQDYVHKCNIMLYFKVSNVTFCSVKFRSTYNVITDEKCSKLNSVISLLIVKYMYRHPIHVRLHVRK